MPKAKPWKPILVGNGKGKPKSSPNLPVSKPLTSTPLIVGRQSLSGSTRDLNTNLITKPKEPKNSKFRKPTETKNSISDTNQSSKPFGNSDMKGQSTSFASGASRKVQPNIIVGKNGPNDQQVPSSSTTRTSALNLPNLYDKSMDFVDGVVNENNNRTEKGYEATGLQETIEASGSKRSLVELCEEFNVNLPLVRRACRQPVGDNDASGICWDGFWIPKEFAGEELPPLPPTPVAAPPLTYADHDQKSPRKEVKRLEKEQMKSQIKEMEIILKKMKTKEEERKKLREHLGIPPPKPQDYDSGSDLNGSFIAEYSPSPVIPERIKKRIVTNQMEIQGHVTPPKRARTSDLESDVSFEESDRVDETPRSKSSAFFDSFNTTVIEESQKVGRRRLLFQEEEPVKTQSVSTNDITVTEEEDEWSGDDEFFTQMDLSGIDPASSNSSSKENNHGSGDTQKSFSQAHSECTISGEGFDESDDSQDLLLSQLDF